MRAAELADKIPGATRSGTHWTCLCPTHDDQRKSLSFKDGDKAVVLKCFAGCTPHDICTALGLTVRDLFFDAGSDTDRRIVTTYDYLDEAGALLFQVVRYEPKDFRQRRPDGHGGWVWKLTGVRRVVYRLPELAHQSLVVIVEGEKDADRLWALGLPSTTNAGGAGKWTDALTQQLHDAGVQVVVIVPDNDDPGRTHAEAVARSCGSRGLTVKMVVLPNVPAKGDLSSFLDAGGTVDEFAALVDATQEWASERSHEPAERPEPAEPAEDQPEEPDAPASHEQPELDCDIGDLDEITRLAWAAIHVGNTPPMLFLYGSAPSRIEQDDKEQRLRLVLLTPNRLRFHAAHLAHWTKTKTKTHKKTVERYRVDCRPPMDVIFNMLAAPAITLPILSRIVEVPVVSHRGRLVQHPGYDPEAHLYYQPYDPAIILSIPMAPTVDEVAAAKARVDDVLFDFPFVGDADKTHAVALAVVPLVRDLIDGPTPLHVLEAPAPGSGKNLLVNSLLSPSVGRRIGLVAEARDDEEWRKRLTAQFREGQTVTVFDNLSHPLESGVVASAITATQWDDRILGKTEMITLPARMIFACTANNPILSMEIARRSIRIRLDPKMDRPWLRDGFRYPDLMDFVEHERPAMITALLTLVQAWIQAGRPKPAAKPLGSFEAWSAIVGGIVEFAGYPHFLGNALEFYEAADSEGMLWRLFVNSWWETYQSRTVSAKDLFDIAVGLDGFPFGRASTDQGKRTVLGHALKKHRDQIVGDFRIELVGIYGSGAQWRLQEITTASPASDEGVESLTLS